MVEAPLSMEAALDTPLAPRVAFGAQPAGYRPTMRQIEEAQKHARMAFSALNFEDVGSAVEDLCVSLRNLTGVTFQVSK